MVIGLSVAACSSPSSEDEAVSSRVFDCSNQIDILDEPPEDWRTVLGVIALPDDRLLQRGRVDEELGRGFSKFGLVLRADQALTITVTGASRPNALIGWNNGLEEPVTSIEINGCSGLCETDYQPGCPQGESGEWIAYPGGVWTADPACIAIEIVAGDRTAIAELPIGAECS